MTWGGAGCAGWRFRLSAKCLSPPGAEVRVSAEASGVCDSDSLTVEVQWPDLAFPRIPGHEIVGPIDVIGASVVGCRAGQRVGVAHIASRWMIDCRNLLIPASHMTAVCRVNGGSG